jgi:3-phosphoshikimate 1-carboxyvinyltransferase
MGAYYTIHTIPGDKSISHRAVIMGSLAHGVTTVNGFLLADDCLNNMAIWQQLGVRIDRHGDQLRIYGRGPRALQSPNRVLDVGNSGTAIRLIAGALGGTSVNATLTGDASIQKRPMGRIIEPLRAMGVRIESSDNGCPPLRIQGNPQLRLNTRYAMPIASAQVKSAVLLAGISAGVPVTVIEPEACRNHTEILLTVFGVPVLVDNRTIAIPAASLTAPTDPIQIPSDISSALFFIAYGILANRPIHLTHVGLNPSRIACITALKAMGIGIRMVVDHTSREPMGDIYVDPSPLRHNVTIPLEWIPNIIDELPIIAMIALTQPGCFRVRGAEELRVKESDRIAGIVRLVQTLGGTITEYPDGFDIHGPQPIGLTWHYDAHFDHRLAMSAAIVSAAYGCQSVIDGSDSIQTSFPNFSAILNDIPTPIA